MASETSEEASPENAPFSSEECETYDVSKAKKRRRKSFLWNPQVSVLSRHKWRTKKSKLAKDTNELEATVHVRAVDPRLHPYISTESDEDSDHQAGSLFESDSSSDNEAQNTVTGHSFPPLCDDEELGTCDVDSSENSVQSTVTDDDHDDYSTSSSETDSYLSSDGDSLTLSEDQECEQEMEGRSGYR